MRKGRTWKDLLSLVPREGRQAPERPPLRARVFRTNGHRQAPSPETGDRRILLVCSPGGHLQQMLSLEPAWRDLRRTWVTLPAVDIECLLDGEYVVTARGPTNRSLANLLRNLPVAWRVVRERDPDVILSTGAGLAVPFFVVGKLLRRRLVYVESLTRTESVSLSGRLVYPLADEFFVQWPEAARKPRMRYEGSVL